MLEQPRPAMATQLAGDLPSNRGGRVLRPSVVSTTQYLRRWPRVHEPSPIVSLSFVAAQGGEPEKRESRKPPRVLAIGRPWCRVWGAPNGAALFIGQPDTASDCTVSALSSSSVSHPSSSYLFLLFSEMQPKLGVVVGMGRTCVSTVLSTAALASSPPFCPRPLRLCARARRRHSIGPLPCSFTRGSGPRPAMTSPKLPATSGIVRRSPRAA